MKLVKNKKEGIVWTEMNLYKDCPLVFFGSISPNNVRNMLKISILCIVSNSV